MAFLFGLFILSFMVPVALPYAAWQLTAGSKTITILTAMFCIAGAAGVQYQMISVGGTPPGLCNNVHTRRLYPNDGCPTICGTGHRRGE